VLFYPPDPGSGSGMEQWSDPDPGSGIKHPGSATLVQKIFFGFVPEFFFRIRIQRFFGFGSVTLQHYSIMEKFTTDKVFEFVGLFFFVDL
jgi:hypothetical protein